jgi:Tfp pilus assembly protein PilF
VDPRFASMVATQLEIIDQAVNELERALEAQPENRMLWLLMAQANESRMEILQTAQTYLY